MLVPISLLGWIITPFATAFTLWVLIKKIHSTSAKYYLLIGIVWAILAVILDYLLIVKAFKPEDGYYKADVYLYYTLTLTVPNIVGLWKQSRALGWSVSPFFPMYQEDTRHWATGFIYDCVIVFRQVPNHSKDIIPQLPSTDKAIT